MTETIPGPPGLPILGNAMDVDPANAIMSLGLLTDTYGPIFKLTLAGREKLYIGSVELMNEICDEKRFAKIVHGPLEQVRTGVADGLFTARPGEEAWAIAHRTLMPAFGPLPIQSMFDEMHGIACQLVVKWARFGPNEKINVTDDFTRLTLDSIALCAMGTRFNSFYHDEMHPFVAAMVDFLVESGQRAGRLPLANYFRRTAQQKYDADIALMKKVATDLIAERRANPTDKKDLLNAMLHGRDPKTGQALTEDSIKNNMITFLIAGHETTSGLLSFLFYNLLKSPASYQAVQREVDDVIGNNPITIEHMSKLPYIDACLRETLRLTPTAPAFSVSIRPDSTEESTFIGGGRYEVKKGQPMTVLLPKIHRDPLVYGPDADEFKPERMLPEAFSKLPPNSWKPFGNGSRACIGRPFAWQEAILAVAMLFQNFDFRMEDPSYQLEIKTTLTLKPKDFYMRANVRAHIDPDYLEKTLYVAPSKDSKATNKHLNDKAVTTTGGTKKPMSIFYGSNAGTCEALAQSLARTASSRGYEPHVNVLDSAVNKVPSDQPVILICSSYEGQPPDNAAHFVEWLQNLKGSKMLGVKYAVFGCGNRDWASTFHKVPLLLQSGFEESGAEKIADIGLGDVAGGDIFGDFDKWQDENLWKALGGNADEQEAGIDVEVDTSSRRSRLRQDVKEAIVLSNELLTTEGEPEKRHIALKLPTGMEYKVGDYLAVLPLNDTKNVRRVLKWASLPHDATLTIKSGSNTTLPTGHPISAVDVLGAYVELGQPATRKNIIKIASSCTDEKKRAEIMKLAGDDFEREVMLKRRSPLDLLEEYPSAAGLPLGDFLAMLPPMRIRQYSISSSPLADPTTATITWSVLDTPSKAASSKRFLGVASNYLSSLEEGDRMHVAVKPSHGHFHPPKDIENTPVIMICAGTGLAPFRGFAQERAMQIKGGRKLAAAYLFIGCQHPQKDVLFSNELRQWEKDGVVEVFYAFSKAKEQSKGCRYVQDRVWEERERMREVFDQGAKLYVCGSNTVGEGIGVMIKKIYEEATEARGKSKTDEEIESWFQDIKSNRYASDVFA
ncbi:Bifunctional cytochrome P450 reductase [Venustampulla echinocandica]|uniref:Bifunctional cytochrome P450/NADPH--P450 reductase n=1 Tax=Venustampulla echinocandica TaxID=2656787 RepID=A0A370T922_9HELO|nr:Bifunctional cytochrome P450 reductase [Venustampulla echinocandica]RDL29977.1 Bifunctional cytochrome P450 reductase [Venustampulla echinocandica]